MRPLRILLLLVLLAAAGGAAWYWLAHRPAASADQVQSGRRGRGGQDGQPIPVLAATATRKDVPVYLDSLGTVQAFNTVNIKAMIDGPLIQVLFIEGQDVKPGDVLARIDPRPYQAALDQAVAKKAQDEATLANAKLDLARYQKLAATAYTSAQTADTQKATVQQTEALIKQDQAQIETARTNLSYTTITSPIEGRTGIRQVDAGNIIHASDTTPLTVVTQLHPISVLFTLPQQTLTEVRAAIGRGDATVLALPQSAANATPASTSTAATAAPDSDATAAAAGPEPTVLDRGKVAVLDNTVDQSTGTIKIKATFPNPNLALWPGGFINVRLLVETVKGAITVPPTAIQRGPEGAYVYLLESNGTAHRQAVQLGHEDETVSVVTSGLQPGDKVVTDGASRLTDGRKVTVQTPGAPAAAEPAATRRRAPGAGRRRAADPG